MKITDSILSSLGRRRTQLWALTAISLTCLASAGCRTTGKSGAPTLASIYLQGNTPGQIAMTTADVFQQHGYNVMRKGFDRLVCEKPAGKWSNFAYGSWIGDSPVWIRVKISIVPAGEAAYRVECIAARVRDKGSSTEEELRIGKAGHGAYQKLLDEVAARFAKAP
jgi:hypothetical protein